MRDPAAAYGRIAADLERALSQDTRCKHLYITGMRAGVLAGRLALDLILKDNRPELRQLYFAAQVVKRPASDASAWWFWRMFVIPWLVAKLASRLRPEFGAYDWPRVKTDAAGKAIQHPDGRLATMCDDYDETDALKHLRLQFGDYAEACRLMSELFETPQDDEVDVVVVATWFDADPPSGSKFGVGPIEGTLKELSRWIAVDHRTLEFWNGRSSWWIKREHRTKFTVWFASQQKYAEANQRRLIEEHQMTSKNVKARRTT